MTARRPEEPTAPGSERDEGATLPSTVRLPRGGPGATVVAGLILVAFLLGLTRPWDLLGDVSPDDGPGQVSASPGTPGRGVAQDAASGSGRPVASGSGVAAVVAPAPVQAPTCAYPESWRTATVQTWAGRRARVWTAVEAIPARGPDDPAIEFLPVISPKVMAIGWCAPIRGAERPPRSATGSLFLVQPDGTTLEVPYDRMEPATPDALGELWVPKPRAVGPRPPWPPGRYVIRLAAPGGSYARYLGIEVSETALAAAPDSSAVPDLSAAPDSSAAPDPSGLSSASPGTSGGGPPSPGASP